MCADVRGTGECECLRPRRPGKAQHTRPLSAAVMDRMDGTADIEIPWRGWSPGRSLGFRDQGDVRPGISRGFGGPASGAARAWPP